MQQDRRAARGPRDPRLDVRRWGPFLAVFALVAGYYEAGNHLLAPSLAVAHRHGLDIWNLERAWHLDWEPAIQHAVQSVTLLGHPALMNFLALVYVGPHFLLTFGLFVWAYWRRPERFAEVRNVFAAFTVIAFGFQWLYPVAPPWQVPETGIAYGMEVLPVTGDDPTIRNLTNPLAAFPSVHTGWALLCAYFLVELGAGGRHAKWWWAYPATIVLCILATGNHFILDVVGVLPFLVAAFLVDASIRRPYGRAAPTTPIVHGPADPALLARWQDIASLPATPRPLGWMRNMWSAIRLGEDYLLSVPPALVPLSAAVRRYPKPFQRTWITMPDGTRLCAWLGAQPRRAPALVIVPGLFTSKDNHVVRRRALRVYREWGYHVLALDMRGNGQSDRRPTTAGWKEAEDLLAVVRHLRATVPVEGVALYGESLAGTAACVAARMAGERGEPFADLGTVVASALHDPAATIEAYSSKRGERQAFARFFTFLLRRSGQPGIRTFRQYHEAGSKAYGRDPAEAARAATPLVPGMRLGGPLLIIHSADDELAPASDLEARMAIVRQTRGAAAWVLPWGHHVLHELSDPEWFWGVLGGTIGPQRLRRAAPAGHRVVEAVAQQA